MAISRRKFAQLLGAGAAAAAARPALTLARASTAEATSTTAQKPGVVRLSANENPYGPSPQALKAMQDSFALSCRYPDDHAGDLVDALAKLNRVDTDQILLGDGSGELLKLCADSFTSPEAGLVAADPTFEAILQHAAVNKAGVVKVPLTREFAHDLPAMARAGKTALVYICNPNNPTASITPRQQLHEFIIRAPDTTRILVDEAYFHYADSSDYESVIPLVKDHPNLIVTRTFSKIYGMAGLRCGYCVAQKQIIDQLRPRQSWDSANIMALVAARASLNDGEQVSRGRRLNTEAKVYLLDELDRMGYSVIPSQANFVMMDVKRSVVPLIRALKQRDVEVGRLFPALPNHMRLTIGRKNEMQAFLSAFREVVAA